MREEQLSFRRELRANSTDAERRLWAQLRRRQLHGFRFRRQHPVGPYVVDFFCWQRRVAVEVDGGQHFDDPGIARDRRRDVYLEREGIRVLRFTNLEIVAQLDGVLEVIAAVLANAPSLPRPAGTRGEE